MTVASSGTKGTEKGVVLMDRMYPYWPQKTGVIWDHGHGSGGGDALDSTTAGPHLAAVTAAGYPVVSMDMGGTATWGTSAATAKMANAIAQLAAAGASTSKIIVLGASMGTLTTLCSILAGTLPVAQVAAVGLMLPAASLVDLHDNNRGGFATEMQTAWGVSGTWAGNATITAADPMQNPASFQSFPMALWYGLADPIVPPSVVTSFASAVGSNVTATGAAGVAHTAACATPAQVVAFVRQYA